MTTDARPIGPPALRTAAPVLVAGLLTIVPCLLTIQQPIVENYVGRQIPTAMVTRNLARGSGFLYPQLDTGPFPSYFLVEPPIYAALVAGFNQLTNLPVDAAGRLVSALAAWIAALALFANVRAPASRWPTMLAFLLLPLSLRYGRAVQPDMLALALVLVGLSGWSRWSERGGLIWFAAGFLTLSAGIATKALGAFALLPVACLIAPRLTGFGAFRPSQYVWTGLLLAAHLIPAGLWYLHAAQLATSTDSAATFGNLDQWTSSLGPAAWFKPHTWGWIARFGLVRAFTPLGLALGAAGLVAGGPSIWRLWTLGALAMLAMVPGKLHHEYYWLWVAPGLAVGTSVIYERMKPAQTAARSDPAHARILERLWFAILWFTFGGLCLLTARSTWRTPDEWRPLNRARALAEGHIPENVLVIAHEATLFTLDRRGMRLENEPAAMTRALAEWGVKIPPHQAAPGTALRWYHHFGARYLVEVGDPARGTLATAWAREARRLALHILADEPGLLVVAFAETLP